MLHMQHTIMKLQLGREIAAFSHFKNIVQSLVKSFRTFPFSGQNLYISHLYFNLKITILCIETLKELRILLYKVLYKLRSKITYVISK